MCTPFKCLKNSTDKESDNQISDRKAMLAPPRLSRTASAIAPANTTTTNSSTISSISNISNIAPSTDSVDELDAIGNRYDNSMESMGLVAKEAPAECKGTEKKRNNGVTVSLNHLKRSGHPQEEFVAVVDLFTCLKSQLKEDDLYVTALEKAVIAMAPKYHDKVDPNGSLLEMYTAFEKSTEE